MKLRNKKTGEFIEFTKIYLIDNKDCVIQVFNSIAELNEKLEDYKPAEPLIKDEKIRKAVRAWAEANGITNIYCYQYKRTCEFACENLVLDRYATIRFIGDDIIDISLNSGTYTITELCGEEDK